MGKKCLFIDDQSVYLESMKGFFKKEELRKIGFAECHSIGEALKAINEAKPKVVFLDHCLTPGGSEGFGVVEALKEKQEEIEVISITMSGLDIAAEYAARGFKVISKSHWREIVQIVQNTL